MGDLSLFWVSSLSLLVFLLSKTFKIIWLSSLLTGAVVAVIVVGFTTIYATSAYHH